MEYIKNIIKKEMISLEEKSDREKLREYNEKYLDETLEFLINDFKSLDSRIFDEVKKEDYDLIFVPLENNEKEHYKDILFPITLVKRKDTNIEKGFLLLEDKELEKIENKTFLGNLISNDNNYEVRFCFKKIDIINELEDKLYKIFKMNKIKWKTLNLAYLDKFYELEILDFPSNINKNNLVLEYDLGDYEKYWFKNYDIYWNLESKIVLSNLMNAELKEEGLFKNFIEINSNYKYLVYPEENENIVDIKREQEKIEILAKEKNIDFYNVLILYDNISKKRLENLSLDYITNEKKALISDMIRQKKSRSLSEIFKIFKVFQKSESVKLMEVKINGYVEKTENIKKYNNFLKNDINSYYGRDKLYLYIKYEKNLENENFLKFILSEIQYRFNELECIIVKV